MTVDLSVLGSVGISLCSNAAAVLSELVANAYTLTRPAVRSTGTGELVTLRVTIVERRSPGP